jgi:hypothetical protein
MHGDLMNKKHLIKVLIGLIALSIIIPLFPYIIYAASIIIIVSIFVGAAYMVGDGIVKIWNKFIKG